MRRHGPMARPRRTLAASRRPAASGGRRYRMDPVSPPDGREWTGLEGTVGTVTVGPVAGPLAGTKPCITCLVGREDDGHETGSLVGAVTERLPGAAPATAPELLFSCLEFHPERRFRGHDSTFTHALSFSHTASYGSAFQNRTRRGRKQAERNDHGDSPCQSQGLLCRSRPGDRDRRAGAGTPWLSGLCPARDRAQPACGGVPRSQGRRLRPGARRDRPHRQARGVLGARRAQVGAGGCPGPGPLLLRRDLPACLEDPHRGGEAPQGRSAGSSSSGTRAIRK